MAGIVAVLPDGTKLEFPEGTPREVVSAAVKRHLGAVEATPGAAAPPGVALDKPATTGGPKKGGFGVSFPARMVRGAVMDRVDPLAEYLVRGVNAIPGVGPMLAPDSEVSRVQSMNRDRAEQYKRDLDESGFAGFDAGRMAGVVATDLATLQGLFGHLGKANLAMPQRVSDVAKAGAVVGGVSSAAAPVADSDKMSNPELLGEKAKQVLFGTGVGAAVAPVAHVATRAVVDRVGDAARRGVSAVKNAMAPSTSARIVNDATQLEVYLASQASSVGIDWQRVPEAVRVSLRESTQRATRNTGDLPEEAIKNRLVATAEELPQLTLGQATRNPTQFSREQNSPDPELRNYLGGQDIAAARRLDQVRAGAGPEVTPYQAGAAAEAAIKAEAAARSKAINDLYTTARGAEGSHATIQNTVEFAKQAMMDLKTKQLWLNTPESLKNQLELLAAEGGRFKLTPRLAAQMLQNLNAQTVSGVDPKNAAIGVIRSQLDALLEAPVVREPAGNAAIQAFKEASKARASKGAWERSSGAIEDLASKEQRTATEKIFERHVLGGPVDDLKAFWKVLPPEAQQGFKRSFVDHVAKLATNSFGTAATSAAPAIRFLDKFPKEKLDTMFTAAELQSLRNVLKYLELTKNAPPGNFVNTSKSAVALQDMLASAQGIPVIGPLGAGPLKRILERAETEAATDPAALLAPSAGRRSPLADLAGRMVPYTGLPAYQTAVGE